MVKVSVIIPNYNHASYLKQRIDSVLHQTFPDFEIIILDDYSTDDSKEIIEQYRNHPKITHIIYNEQNSGSTFSQWFKGFKVAKGEYIWIAESDDDCEPTLLAELIKPMVNSDKIVLSFCQSILISAENNFILDLTKALYLSNIENGKDFIKTRLLSMNEILNASMVVFRKSALSSVSLDFDHMKYCGDWYMWVNICLNGDVFESGKYLNYYLRHNNSTITNASRNGLDFLEGNDIIQFIKRELVLSESEIEKVFTKRMELYKFLKPFFLNKEVSESVYKSMLDLDPSMASRLSEDENKRPSNMLSSLISKLKLKS